MVTTECMEWTWIMWCCFQAAFESSTWFLNYWANGPLVVKENMYMYTTLSAYISEGGLSIKLSLVQTLLIAAIPHRARQVVVLNRTLNHICVRKQELGNTQYYIMWMDTPHRIHIVCTHCRTVSTYRKCLLILVSYRNHMAYSSCHTCR